VSDRHNTGMSRRRLLKVVGMAAAVAAVWGQFPMTARADDLRPNDPRYHFTEYEAIVNRAVTNRQLFAWPNLFNATIYANIKNSLNGFQFSYDFPPNQTQVVVQAYASANVAMYDDFIWAKYRLGELMGVTDAATGKPALRNVWYPSASAAPATVPTDRSSPYYADGSIAGLQRRGVLFLTCHQSVYGTAGTVANDSTRNVDRLTADQIVAEIEAHLVPGALLVPAAVGELVRLQEKGYRLVVNG
jgi:intracellular sulfur oxidation DsrE/DsrF family protein